MSPTRVVFGVDDSDHLLVRPGRQHHLEFGREVGLGHFAQQVAEEQGSQRGEGSRDATVLSGGPGSRGGSRHARSALHGRDP